MKIVARRVIVFGFMILCLSLISSVQPLQAQPVIIRVVTDQVFDTVYTPKPVSIIMTVDPNGVNVASIAFGMRFDFTNGNIIGPMTETSEYSGSPAFIFSSRAQAIFEQCAVNNVQLSDFSDEPFDTLMWGVLDFTGDGTWSGPMEIARITFLPLDTGTITISPVRIAPGGPLDVMDQHGVTVPYDWEQPTIHIPKQPGPIGFRLRSSYGNDTLYVGGKATLFFDVYASGDFVSSLLLALTVDVSNPALRPPTTYTDGFLFAPVTEVVFENRTFFSVASAPDTIQWHVVDLDGAGWTTSASVAELSFVPADTGTLSFDTTNLLLPDAVGAQALDQSDSALPVTWQPRTFTVVPCPVMMGDVNADGLINSADIVYLVSTVFRGGPMPIPRAEAGDVACKGRLDAAGIIYLVRYVFKGGEPPCACFVKRI